MLAAKEQKQTGKEKEEDQNVAAAGDVGAAPAHVPPPVEETRHKVCCVCV
jgi:hypothetical protein